MPIHLKRTFIIAALVTVLIGSGQEGDLVATLPLIASKNITGNGCVGVADVRHVIHIIDRSCNVEMLIH